MDERKNLDEKRHESEERCRLLIHGLDAVIWEADPATLQFSFVSDRAESILGYPAEQWLKEPNFWVEHIHPDDREQALSFCRTAINEGRDHRFEYRALAADGRVVWLRDIVRIVPGGEGKVRRLLGLMIDITQNKQMEETLRNSEERFRTAFAQAAVGQAMSDRGVNFIQVNKAFCDMTGYTEQELCSMNLDSITHPEDYPSCMEHIRELWSGKINSFIIEKRFITKSGDPVWVRSSVSSVRDKLGTLVT